MSNWPPPKVLIQELEKRKLTQVVMLLRRCGF
jgi:hypothetical protein